MGNNSVNELMMFLYVMVFGGAYGDSAARDYWTLLTTIGMCHCELRDGWPTPQSIDNSVVSRSFQHKEASFRRPDGGTGGLFVVGSHEACNRISWQEAKLEYKLEGKQKSY